MHRILLAAIALGLSAVAVNITTSENNDTAEALHAMPCPDLNADGVVTPPGDVALSATYPPGMPIPPAPAPLDMDGDTFATPIDTGFIAGAVGLIIPCQDTPVGPGPAAGPAADYDGDLCTNIEEMGVVPMLGGGRDIYNHWDFYSVPTGVALIKDAAVSAADFFGVLGRFGAVDPTPGKVDPPGTLPPPAPAYHSAFDRGPAVAPFFPVDLGPPDGAIAAADFFATLGQFGHTCVPPP